MCTTLHLHVQFVTAGTVVQKRMIVTLSSFLEDAARQWICLHLIACHPFGNMSLILLPSSLLEYSLDFPFACCTLFPFGDWILWINTVFIHLCYYVKITVAYISYLYIPMWSSTLFYVLLWSGSFECYANNVGISLCMPCVIYLAKSRFFFF